MQNEYRKVLALFAKHFTTSVWQQAQILLMGAIQARGQRTVAELLRVMGLGDEQHFDNYHRVLNRAIWSSLAISQTLLQLVVQVFAPSELTVIGGDPTGGPLRCDTIEGRRGDQVKAKGIYRDPVRSSHIHCVKANGLRWLTLMLLVPIPFAERLWALRFLTVLVPSERCYQGKGRAHKKTDRLNAPATLARRALAAGTPDCICG